MSFQVHGLPQSAFSHLFGQPERVLQQHRATRIVADASPGYPCRISLSEAEIGEPVILVNYEHQPADNPYRAAHAVFVREGAIEVSLEPDRLPDVLCRRVMSLRAFSPEHWLMQADVAAGSDLRVTIEALLADPDIEYLQLHHAKQGCYAATVRRTVS